MAKTTINGQDVTLVAIHLSKPYFDEAAWVELRQAGYFLQGIKGPVVLTGDFNAAAWSGTVADFVANNALVPPPRFPATWPVRLGPLGVPIDNMFSRDGALIESIDALDSSIGSNHRVSLAQIAIMPPPRSAPGHSERRLEAPPPNIEQIICARRDANAAVEPGAIGFRMKTPRSARPVRIRARTCRRAHSRW